VLHWQAACFVEFFELGIEEARTLSELQRLVVYLDFSLTDTASNDVHCLQMGVFFNDGGRHLLLSVTTDFDS
jgi:hypothetical protein